MLCKSSRSCNDASRVFCTVALHVKRAIGDNFGLCSSFVDHLVSTSTRCTSRTPNCCPPTGACWRGSDTQEIPALRAAWTASCIKMRNLAGNTTAVSQETASGASAASPAEPVAASHQWKATRLEQASAPAAFVQLKLVGPDTEDRMLHCVRVSEHGLGSNAVDPGMPLLQELLRAGPVLLPAVKTRNLIKPATPHCAACYKN